MEDKNKGKDNEKQPTPEEREKLREDELVLLKSEPARNLYLSAMGRDVAQYGEVGKDSTISNYFLGLSQADGPVGRITSRAFYDVAQQALQAGKDPRESGAPTPSDLLDSARGVYSGAINKVKVQDVLNLMEIKGVHSAHIPEEQRSMYMEDYAKANPKMYHALVSTYLSSTEREGIGTSMVQSGRTSRKSLEKILQTDPKDLQK